MPRYFFDIDGVPDDRGQHLDSIDEARVVARQRVADDLARTIVGTGYFKSCSCLVRDSETGGAVRVIMALLIEDMNNPGGGPITFQPA